MSFDIDKAAAIASNIIAKVAPLLEEGATIAGHPEIASGLSTAERVLTTLLAGEPAAKKLVDQVVGGTPLTGAQVTQDEADNMSAYARSKASLAAAIAAAN